MYEELVKKMRQQCADMRCGNCNTCLNGKAADAIDELSQKAQQLPCWIPVTERLPNGEAKRYLAASLMSFGSWVSICYYADNLEEVDEYDFKDENHGGFYGYDGERGYYELSGVKYWMPLPEPPKEE